MIGRSPSSAVASRMWPVDTASRRLCRTDTSSTGNALTRGPHYGSGRPVDDDDLTVPQLCRTQAGRDHSGDAELASDDRRMGQCPTRVGDEGADVGNSTDHTGDVAGQTSTSPGGVGGTSASDRMTRAVPV